MILTRAISTLLFLCVCAAAQSGARAGAQDMPRHVKDVVEVTFLPGWQMEDGTRMAGLSIRLAKGWKTYWRSPGDGGLPTRITTNGSSNLRALEILWPRPTVFRTAGLRSVGYRDTVVLPLHLTMEQPGPVTLKLTMDFGVCDDVCIPVRLSFSHTLLPSHLSDVPQIVKALEARPKTKAQGVKCRFEPAGDGMALRLLIHTEELPGRGEALVVETQDPYIWVSEPFLARDGNYVHAITELVVPGGQAKPVDPETLTFTLISSRAAVSFEGCSTR